MKKNMQSLNERIHALLIWKKTKNKTKIMEGRYILNWYIQFTLEYILQKKNIYDIKKMLRQNIIRITHYIHWNQSKQKTTFLRTKNDLFNIFIRFCIQFWAAIYFLWSWRIHFNCTYMLYQYLNYFFLRLACWTAFQ